LGLVRRRNGLIDGYILTLFGGKVRLSHKAKVGLYP
jgi:hypothetical protein